uniref:Uncharacterized protein n=1 Tax=Euplotes crassus TaxID=5936 RepID=A0A7S3P260_EUPCR|mmetsp:Transcript_7327/g.6844  ORF Transcript_7327/g.6844 Transcript_7327/m.6844 type:complete len:271 (+) Transcript_7327:185-997(+)
MGDFDTAITDCMQNGENINLDRLIRYVEINEKSRYIDKAENLVDDHVYVFSGLSDFRVLPIVNRQTAKFYERMGSNVKSIFDFDAGHNMPTEDFGIECKESTTPFIGKCNMNGALSSLRYLHPQRILNTIGEMKLANLFSLKQTTGKTVMGPEAYAYIPKACQNSLAQCSLHVVFHGCQQTIDHIGLTYVESTGYNEIAEVNEFVILYPQAYANEDLNPLGCWDWWGFTGKNYATKFGKQVAEVKRLINALKSGQIDSTQVYTTSEVIKE